MLLVVAGSGKQPRPSLYDLFSSPIFLLETSLPVNAYLLLLQSSECNVWFDKRSRKRKRDFEGGNISKHIEDLVNQNRNVLHEGLAELSQTGSVETSISAFKRIRFDIIDQKRCQGSQSLWSPK